VRQSFDRTNRLLVLHEATRTAGFGAELAVELGEIGFKLLDAPITRVTAEDLSVPAATPPADEIFSAKVRLRPTVEELLAF
jgi:2-oxoisovalerate dehydrogenase E1 component